jgi:V8-like Glu-specific endopeptidase
MHSNAIDEVNDGGIFYDIDTSGDQSGSPVYILDEDNTKLVGIHKSYWPRKHLGYATMITE